MPGSRLEKVAESIRQEVAQILQRELKDPRVGFVTVTRVEITPDLERATVYVSLLDGKGSAEETEAGLKSSAGFVRKLLGERLRIRVTPEVRFRLDSSVAETARISKLLEELKKEREEKERTE